MHFRSASQMDKQRANVGRRDAGSTARLRHSRGWSLSQPLSGFYAQPRND